MNFPKSFTSSAAVLVTAGLLLLAGCGGGGGSSPSPVVESTAPPANTAPVVPTLVASSYVAGSEELAAFNLLNNERDRCGFGRLVQNTQLDAAARAHADYQIINNVLTHTESAGNPRGFTGVTPSDRIVAAGYTTAGGVTDEIVGFFGTRSKAGLGVDGLRGLLSAPYHLRGLVTGYRDVGLAVRSSADVGTATTSVYLQINAAYTSSAGPQVAGANDINTYPCEGSTGLNRQLTNETPEPVPGRNLATEPLGTVVYIAAREGNTLQLSAASMTEADSGRAVTLRRPVGDVEGSPGTSNIATRDPHGGCSEGCFKSHQAYVAPNAPLLANTAYRVTLTGTNNGAAFTRSFGFTTGAGG